MLRMFAILCQTEYMLRVIRTKSDNSLLIQQIALHTLLGSLAETHAVPMYARCKWTGRQYYGRIGSSGGLM